MKKYSDKFKYNNSFSDSLPTYGSTYIKKSNSSNPFSIAKPFIFQNRDRDIVEYDDALECSNFLAGENK